MCMITEGIIDFHTHAFPDAVADKAMSVLQADAEDVKAHLDGKISSLIASMDSCGIASSVVCSIATKPGQFEPIFKWSGQIASDRIIPFPSIHPADTEYRARIAMIKEAGFKGIKMHPFYQDFYLDEDRMMGIYEAISDAGLILVMHTGYDIAFDRIDRADPAKIVEVIGRFSELKLVTTHLGGWQMWDQVRQMLLGKPIYMGISYSMDDLGLERARDLIVNHPAEYVLFGTDSPWKEQSTEVRQVMEMGLDEKRLELMMRGNAAQLLAIK